MEISTNNKKFALKNLLLKTYKENSAKYLTKEEICDLLPNHFPRHTERTHKSNSTAFREIRRCIVDLNLDETIQHIYISNNKGFKVATEKEARDYLKRKFNQEKRVCQRMNIICNKIKNDGQLRFQFSVYETTIINTFGK